MLDGDQLEVFKIVTKFLLSFKVNTTFDQEKDSIQIFLCLRKILHFGWTCNAIDDLLKIFYKKQNHPFSKDSFQRFLETSLKINCQSNDQNWGINEIMDILNFEMNKEYQFVLEIGTRKFLSIEKVKFPVPFCRFAKEGERNTSSQTNHLMITLGCFTYYFDEIK